jgi:hypothetical protein
MDDFMNDPGALGGDPRVHWYTALSRWWVRRGDLSGVADLLRAQGNGCLPNEAIPPFAARVLAEILDGNVKPCGAGGGHGLESQRKNRERDRRIRELYPLVKAWVKHTGRGKRGIGQSAAELALQHIAAEMDVKVGIVKAAVDKKHKAKALTVGKQFDDWLRKVHNNSR